MAHTAPRRTFIAAWSILTVAALVVSLSPLKSGFADRPSRGPGDVALYRAEVDRIGRGEGYYEAAATELRARGYPTRSRLNWRTPLPMAFLGWLPDPRLGQALLAGLGLLALVWAFDAVAADASAGVAPPSGMVTAGCTGDGCRAGSAPVSVDWRSLAPALGAFALMTGAWMPTILGNLYVMPELWSGLLVTLAVLASAGRRGAWAVLAGVAALFLRELAAPAVLVLAAFAIWGGHWRQTLGWALGLAAYAGFYAWHASQVGPLIGPNDLAHAGSWWQWGGLPFVLSTCQMNAYLLILPQWATALVFSLAWLGVWGWQTRLGARVSLVLAGYFAAFALAGYDFNQYWGSMFAPLLALAAGRGAGRLAWSWGQLRRGIRPAPLALG